MSQPKFGIARIRNNLARRAAMCVAFPALLVWFFNWRLIVLPFVIAWNAAEAAFCAAVESVLDDLGSRSLRLLGAAWLLVWREPVGEVDDAEPE